MTADEELQTSVICGEGLPTAGGCAATCVGLALTTGGIAVVGEAFPAGRAIDGDGGFGLFTGDGRSPLGIGAPCGAMA